MRPLSKLGFSIFPRDATDFFVNATNQALENRGNEKKASYTYMENINIGNPGFYTFSWDRSQKQNISD